KINYCENRYLEKNTINLLYCKLNNKQYHIMLEKVSFKA
ncbi:hypothetical protein QQ3_1477, partial [Clostridioides difficile Y266]